MVVHTDHDERALRSGGGDRGQPGYAVRSEHRLVDDDHCGGYGRDQPGEVLHARRCRERLDPRLRLEEVPEGRPDGLVAGGDDDGDRGVGDVGVVGGHVDKHRPAMRTAHPGVRLNRRP